MEDQEAYHRAKRRVEARMGFYWHLGAYLGVNGVLAIINLNTSPKYLWFKWPLLGWGIGVFFHGLSVFPSRRIGDMKKKMIEREMAKEAKPKE